MAAQRGQSKRPDGRISSASAAMTSTSDRISPATAGVPPSESRT
jgi:hypothetical protein